MTGFQYKKNVYRCENCGHETVTVDRDEGVTPFVTGCPSCKKGSAVSEVYRVDQARKPTHEWYRPTVDELKGKPMHVLDHVGMGGLLLREIPRPPTLDEVKKLAISAGYVIQSSSRAAIIEAMKKAEKK